MEFRTMRRGALAVLFAAASLLARSACRAQEVPDADMAPWSQHSEEGEILYRKRRSVGSHAIQTEGVSDAFLLGVIDISRRIGCQPGDLIAVMIRESSLRPDAWNRSSNAVGLIQFLPSTLAKLGWHGSWQEFRALGAEEQLFWVERYMRVYSRYGLSTPGRVYQAVFMPASLRMAAGANTTLIDSQQSTDGRYQNNRGLDLDGDGRITVGELRQSVERGFRTSAWQTLEARLQELDHGSGGTRYAGTRPPRSADEPGWGDDPQQDESRGGRLRQPAQRGESSRLASRSAQYRDDLNTRSGIDEPDAVDLRSAEGLTDALTALGYNVRISSLDGAVRAFQRRMGLPADGVVGPRTRSALASALVSSGAATSM